MTTLRDRFIASDNLRFVLVGAAAAALAAREIVKGQLHAAIALAAVPALVWLVAQPAVLLVVLGASLPWVQNVVGGGGGGYNVSASDLLLVAIGGGILLERAGGQSLPIGKALRPVAAPLILYSAVMLLLLTLHPIDVAHIAKTGQRFELFLLPLAVGAFAALRNIHLGLLKGYMIAATALALVWPFDQTLGQKNPVGQFIANAILLLVALPALRRLLPSLIILIPGLLITQSRGAILATVLGVIVILAVRGFGIRFILVRGVPLAIVAAVAFFVLPSSYQSRITTLAPGQQTRAQYSIKIRQQLSTDAKHIIRDHPATGVGVGGYYAADSKITTRPVLDPHQVLYLQAAEGGYGLALSFIVLVVGLVLAVWRMKNVTIAAAAAGVLVATAAHGLVDVYWVRGTPVLSFLLVGMVCGSLLRERAAASAG